MQANIIDGKKYANQIKEHLKEIIITKVNSGLKPPGLAVILVGEDPASTIYVRNKREACEHIGIQSFYHHLSPSIEEKKLIDLIHHLNADPAVHGILLQLPLPDHINAEQVINEIDPEKDVDGFHAYNLGRLLQRKPTLVPCTPKGIMTLLQRIDIDCKGKHAVIIGTSTIVGRPMALLLLKAGATITVCHRLTKDLPSFIKQADILVSAVGKPGLVQSEWLKEEVVAIDVGITRLPNGTLAGDIEFEKAQKKASFITPVPGGVGPMTVASLLENTLTAAGFI